MAQLAAALPYIQAAGAVVAAGSTIASGIQAQKNSELQASQMVAKGKEESAIAQREAIQERKRAKFIQSRAKAVAASSGAGADDKTVNDIISDIGSEGEIRALNALYSGEARSRTLNAGAITQQIEGRNKRAAANVGAAGTLLSSGSSLYQRFG